MKGNQQVLEEATKRFQQIMEYTTMRHKFVDEAGEEDPQGEEQMPPADGAMPPMDPNAGAPAPGGEMPPMDGQQPPVDQMGGEGAMPPSGGDAPQGPEGFNPQVPDEASIGEVSPEAGEPMEDEGGLQPDDEVIDISDLTDSQEETQKDVDKLDDKFDKVMKCLGQFEELIRSNDEKINDLKAEFEKRNPTQIEKLSMQTANSYPFNVTPEEFWAEKEKTTNYRTEDDDNGKEQGQYVITKKDVDGAVDWKNISDSLDDFDIMHQTLRNTTGLPF